jgi:RNA polymerase sigma-70 factor (ECF subfamily)
MKRLRFIAAISAGNDEAAMDRLQSRSDHHAFVELVRRWEQPILRLCAKMTGDLFTAEELKQETFSRVFTRRRDFRPGMRFSTWVWRIALNLCYDELRRVQRRGEHALAVADNAEPWLQSSRHDLPPDEQTALAEESDIVRAALLRLPENVRAVLVLRICEGLKLREVGAILALPESTVRYQLGEGLHQLNRFLEPILGPSANHTISAAARTGSKDAARNTP